jgi:hypothetical protein
MRSWVLLGGHSSDEAGAEEGLIRVVDDSGEDYDYPSNRFVLVEVPPADVPRLLAGSTCECRLTVTGWSSLSRTARKS